MIDQKGAKMYKFEIRMNILIENILRLNAQDLQKYKSYFLSMIYHHIFQKYVICTDHNFHKKG